MNPHGQMEAHNEAKRLRHRAAASSPELAGIGRGGRQRFKIAREGIRVRSRPSEGASEGAASWAELVQSSPLGLT
jgi:hypothetical protein